MASRKAVVESVRPSALALRRNVRSGKRGGLMRLRIEGITVCHGSSAARSRRGERLTTAVLSTRSLMNSRRVVICVKLVSNLLAPLRIIFLQQLRGLIDVPVVTRASLVFDLGHVVFDHSITPDKDRSISLKFIEARPDRTSLRFFDHYPIKPVRLRRVRLLHPLNASQLRLLKPRYRRLNRLNHRRRWILDRHQKPHNPYALTTTQRDHFILPRRRRRER